MALSQHTPASSELHRDANASTTDQVFPASELVQNAAKRYRAHAVDDVKDTMDTFLENASLEEVKFMADVLQIWQANSLRSELFTILSAFESATTDLNLVDYVKVPERNTTAVLKFLDQLDAPPTAFKPQENGWRLWKPVSK